MLNLSLFFVEFVTARAAAAKCHALNWSLPINA